MRILLFILVSLNFSFANGKEQFSLTKRKITKSIDIDASIEILNQSLKLVRYHFKEDSLVTKSKLISSNFYLLQHLVSKYKREFNACDYTEDRELSYCYENYLIQVARSAYKQKKIDKIQYKSLALIATYIKFENGLLKLVEPKVSRRKQRKSLKNYLPGFCAYMQNLNYFTYKRQQNEKDPELSEEVLGVINIFYSRKIKKIGKLSEHEYLFANFNRLQIMEMADLLNQTTNMMTAKSGEILLQHEDYSSIYEQIEEKENKIDELIRLVTLSSEEVARVYYDKQITKISEDIITLRKEVALFDLQDQIEKAKTRKQEIYKEIIKEEEQSRRTSLYMEIKELDELIKTKNEEILSKSTVVKLTHGDIYTFTMNWLKQQLHDRKVIKSKASQLFGTNASFGDLVMAGFVSGQVDGEVIKAILELPDMHENYQTPIKQALSIGSSIGRMFLTINPITSPYATLAFVLFDALRNKKQMERKRANEAHLI